VKPRTRLAAQPEQLVEWLAGIARGNERDFQQLYRATAPHLYALLLRILKSEERAEDALQDAYVKIWQKAETYSAERGAPLTWLLSVARYRALDMLRRNRPEVALPEEPDLADVVLADTTSAGPYEDNMTLQAMDAIEACLADLPEEQRQALLMAYYEGLTHAELAKRMDAPLGTVKSWVRRGLLKLRESLTERGQR
jgi:RNA polymerase sigma-70 factor (ECF subfamily)